MERVSAFIPPLLAAYAARPGVPRSAARDEMFTIDPCPTLAISGMAARQSQATAVRLTRSAASHPSVVTCVTGPPGRPEPATALLTSDGEAPEALDGGGHERVARRLVREVGRGEHRFAAFGCDRRGHLLAPGAVAAGDDDTSPLLREQTSHGPSEARGGAGDDGDLTCESTRTRPGHDRGRSY